VVSTVSRAPEPTVRPALNYEKDPYTNEVFAHPVSLSGGSI
jgi:hypothetical protein